MLIVLLLACGDGTDPIRAELEEGGISVLAVYAEPTDDGGSTFQYAGTKDGTFCTGSIGRSGYSLGCVSSTSSATSQYCVPTGHVVEQSWRCEHLADAAACTEAGVMLYEQQKPAALALLRRGCDLGDGESCKNLGLIMRDGLLEQATDTIEAGRFFELACQAGYPAGCRMRGNLLKTVDNPRACGTTILEWLDRGAHGGEAASWNDIGQYQEHCPQGDKAAARDAYRRACDGGLALGCTNLGLMLTYGPVGERDVPAAGAAYTKACDAPEPDREGCVEASLHAYNQGDRAIDGEAMARARKACDLGSAAGCRNVGVILRDDGSAPAEWRAMFEKACSRGDQPSCDELARYARRP